MAKKNENESDKLFNKEGAHGPKSHQQFLQQLHSAANGEADEDEGRSEKNHSQRRLTQDRQQHDEAEKNSEMTRLSREMDRGNIPEDRTNPMTHGTRTRDA
jgi:hypothetical protein